MVYTNAMIIFQRVGPAFAAAACAVSFLVVASSPKSVYVAAPVCLFALWWVASSLPSTRLGERFERLLVLAMPYLAGGWLWLLVDQVELRQWLPIVTVGLVLLSGEVLFQGAYQRGIKMRLWMAVATALLAWFGATGLSLGNLLVAKSALVAAGIGSVYVLGLLHHIQWVYSLPRDPWWVQASWLLIYWQVLWGVLLLPVPYSVQSAAAMLLTFLGLRLRLGQRMASLNRSTPWAMAISLVISLLLVVALVIAAV